MSRRTKLEDGAVISHARFGELTIRMTIRDNVMPPLLWEALKPDGSLGAPSAFSERKLHFMLRPYEYVWREPQMPRLERGELRRLIQKIKNKND